MINFNVINGIYCNTALEFERRKAGLSQIDLAKLAGIELHIIQNYEEGLWDEQYMRSDVADKLYRAMGYTIIDARG